MFMYVYGIDGNQSRQRWLYQKSDFEYILNTKMPRAQSGLSDVSEVEPDGLGKMIHGPF